MGLSFPIASAARHGAIGQEPRIVHLLLPNHAKVETHKCIRYSCRIEREARSGEGKRTFGPANEAGSN